MRANVVRYKQVVGHVRKGTAAANIERIRTRAFTEIVMSIEVLVLILC